MFEVSCLDSNGNSIVIHQWDLNQTVTFEIHGCDESYLQYEPEVHFANINSKEAIVVPAKVKEGTVDTIIADIPNVLLTEHYPLFVYIYLFTDTTYANDSLEENEVKHRSQATVLRTEIPVLRRVRPSDYNYVQNVERVTAKMIISDAQEHIDSAMEEFNDVVETATGTINTAVENATGAIDTAVTDATAVIQDKIDEFNANAENAIDAAVQEIKDAVDETYVNIEGDVVYDLDEYEPQDNDGKVLSASEGAEIVRMIEEKTDYFGLCDTDAATQMKVVEVATDNFAPKKGTILHVRFAHENTYSKPKLSVNGTTSVSIQASGTEGAYWQAHQVVTFVYDDQSDMGENVSPIWQVVSSPVYTNGDIIGNAAEKHIVLSDSDVNDQMRFNYGSNTKMYLSSNGLNMGQDNDIYDEYGNLISSNGIPVLSGNIDPNTVTEHCVYTYHDNMPHNNYVVNVGGGNTEPQWTLLTYFTGPDKQYSFQIATNRNGTNSSQGSGTAKPMSNGPKTNIYYRSYASSDGEWSGWHTVICEDSLQLTNLIGNNHMPNELMNTGYSGTNGAKAKRYVRLVYDSGADQYYLRYTGVNDVSEDLDKEAASRDVNNGSIGYPWERVFTRNISVCKKSSDGKHTAVTKFETNGSATIGGSMSVAGITTIDARIQPSADDAVQLGTGSLRFMNVYCKNSAMSTSDLNAKRDLSSIDDRYIELFDLIQPYTYYFKSGDRVHTGFISQYVEEAMKQVGLAAEELAFFCKDIKTELVYDEDGKIIGEEEVCDEDGNPVYVYALRYEEYIAIMTEKIKRMEKKHEEEISSLQKQIDELKAIVLNK